MKKSLLIVACLLALLSCTKTIRPNLDTVAPQIIIQGAISDTAGPYYVSVNNTVGFYADNVYPGVSGAAITITDSTTGVQDALTETAPGLYMTHAITQGAYGHVYQLHVVLGGKTFQSSSTMPQPVLLDSLSFDTTDSKKLRPQANYKDPAGMANFYKYSVAINGKPDPRFQTFEDRLSDGRYIQDKVDADTSEFRHGDLVRLSLVCVDKRVYTYLSEAEKIAYSNDIQSAPSNAVSNISGGCLGYFSAQTVSSKTALIK